MTEPAASATRPGARAAFCPGCGADLRAPRSFVQEYWSADQENYFCWCDRCGGQFVVAYSERIVSYEPEH